jgi:hypothetical protein
MGILTSVIRAAKPAHYGGSTMRTSDVLQASSDSVNAKSSIEWCNPSPTVVRTPPTATVKQADRAEREALRYEVAVNEGLRVLSAEGRRQKAHAKLITGHRRYLRTTAKAQHQMSAANRGLAGDLHNLRVQSAQLGYSLDRVQERADQQIEAIAHKYGAVK